MVGSPIYPIELSRGDQKLAHADVGRHRIRLVVALAVVFASLIHYRIELVPFPLETVRADVSLFNE